MSSFVSHLSLLTTKHVSLVIAHDGFLCLTEFFTVAIVRTTAQVQLALTQLHAAKSGCSTYFNHKSSFHDYGCEDL